MRASILISAMGLWLALAAPASAWKIASPDHEQTYASATETNRVWRNWKGHLAVLLTFTNDPFVDRANPRQWDNFRFEFPSIRLGADGRTFYSPMTDGRRMAVARIKPGFLDVDEVRLLPNVEATVLRPHGYITVYLNVRE